MWPTRTFKERKKLLTLPNEIWLHIASFISKDCLVKLYFVCTPLFELAMNEIYREVRLYHPGDPSTNRCLRAMDSAAAARVRSLVLRPHLLASGQSKKISFLPDTKDHKIGKLVFKFFERNGKLLETPEEVASRVLLGNITQMVKLESLVVGCYPMDSWMSFNKSSSFLNAAWTQAATLRSVTLDLPMECMANVLSRIPFLPSLQHLKVSLRQAWLSSTDLDSVYDRVAAFINSQSSTLTQLAVDSPSSTPWSLLGTSRVFNVIEYLPKIKEIYLGIPVELLGSTISIDECLKKHDNQLQALRLILHGPGPTTSLVPLPHPGTLFQHSIFKLAFPVLETLDLSLLPWRFEYGGHISTNLTTCLVTYLSQFRQNLQNLVIWNCAITESQIQAVVSVLSHRSTKLRTLKLRSQTLNGAIMDLLAEGLPDLRELDITIDTIGISDAAVSHYTYRADHRQFTYDMETRVYKDWGLRHLKVSPLYYSNWEGCRKALCDSLPQVITFNGCSRAEFPHNPVYTDFT
ncbi:hypothetical protein CPB83DRAFT_221814 [Crepidotus variabilis]|uniref:F-box domain-containing protein n=1 Tax=Crepidotus variabilis TaxID=179855 RepID=A0A9P6ERT1_9AGAR|nr:hypothetical protein CPB83DRAFT_221814 [Crepidotus variabilis]